MRVDQLPSETRVPPQVPKSAPTPVLYWAKVQVWSTYSFAIQMLLPSTAVAP
jgi:hypothetical protein